MSQEKSFGWPEYALIIAFFVIVVIAFLMLFGPLFAHINTNVNNSM